MFAMKITVCMALMLRQEEELQLTTATTTEGWFNGTIVDPEYWSGSSTSTTTDHAHNKSAGGHVHMDDPCHEVCEVCDEHYDSEANMHAFEECVWPAFEDGGACTTDDHGACHDAHVACDTCADCGCEDCAVCHETTHMDDQEEHHVDDHDDPCYDYCGGCHECHEDEATWQKAEQCAMDHPSAAACAECDSCDWAEQDCEATCGPCWDSTIWDDCMPCQDECFPCDTCWTDVHAADIAQEIKDHHIPDGCEEPCDPCADCIGQEKASGSDHGRCEAAFEEDADWQQGCADCDACDWDSCDWTTDAPCHCETLCFDSCWGRWEECHSDGIPEACVGNCGTCKECVEAQEDMGMGVTLITAAGRTATGAKKQAGGHLLVHKAYKHKHSHKASHTKATHARRHKKFRASRRHNAYQVLSRAKDPKLVKRFQELKKQTTKRSAKHSVKK